MAGGGEGYLNFMGNEFGHPEWIDFPREGNGWSFHYCRRQWSLEDNGFLKYQWLGDFDRDMLKLTQDNHIFAQRMGDLMLNKQPEKMLAFYRHGLLLYQWLGDFDRDMLKLTQDNHIFAQRMGDLMLNKQPEKMLAFYRHGLLFAFNFHPSQSLEHVLVPVHQPGEYTVALSTDDEKYGGWNQIQHITYPTKRNFHPSQSLEHVLVPVHQPGEYTVALSTDDEKYGGWNQIQHITYPTKRFDGKDYVELYLPARTAVVLKERTGPQEDVQQEPAKVKKPRTTKSTAKAPKSEKAKAPKKTAKKPAAEKKAPAEKKPSTRKRTAKAPATEA